MIKNTQTIAQQIEALQELPVPELQRKWLEVFGTSAPNGHRVYLWRRIAYRIQQKAEGLSLEAGGLSERARARLAELMETAPSPRRKRLPTLAELLPKSSVVAVARPRDPRLPPAGTVLRREFREQVFEVTVHENDFEYRGRRWDTLSSVARDITGTRWNGFLFFQLGVKTPAKP